MLDQAKQLSVGKVFVVNWGHRHDPRAASEPFPSAQGRSGGIAMVRRKHRKSSAPGVAAGSLTNKAFLSCFWLFLRQSRLHLPSPAEGFVKGDEVLRDGLLALDKLVL